MAHWSYLRSCRSPQEAVADFAAVSGDAGGTLEARYSIPLFWLAAFDVQDVLRVRASAEDPNDVFVVLCASGAAAAARLQMRAAAITKLLPAAYAAYFEEWIRFVKATFPQYLVLRAEDVFSMEGYGDAELRVTAALRSLSAADAGKPIKELDALDHFGSFRDLFDSRLADEEQANTAMRIRTQLAGFNRIAPTALDGWPRLPTAAELAFVSRIKTAAALPLSPEQARLTRTIRNGATANNLREGVAMAAGKLSGRIPLGADAPTKTLRKVIGGGGELLELLRAGFFGTLGLLLGPLFLWVGFSGVIQWSLVGLGFACLAVAVFLLRSATRSFRNLRTITRA